MNYHRISALCRLMFAVLAIAGCAALVSLLLGACAMLTSVETGKPLDPAQVQQDLAMINYLMTATGCQVAQAGALAVPAVTVTADAEGNQVLQALDASGLTACRLVVPPTALPVPAVR